MLPTRHIAGAAAPEANAQRVESRNAVKVLTRHVWEAFKEQINANRLTVAGKRIYAQRKETVERSFSDAKELHGYAASAVW